jgi:folate-binding protein YgfZ
MDDNLPPAQGPAFALPEASVLAIEGPDAVKFAHAQFMSDVASLTDGHWHWSGWLTPKGRVIALFALLRFEAQSLWLLLPDADAGALQVALQRFVFRSKVALAVREDRHVYAAFAVPASANGSRIGDVDGIELDMGTPESPRRLSIGERTVPIDLDAATRWNRFDLAHGLPRLDASQAGQWTPQQLSLDRLHAYSVKKGCYPGQEIVARTHFLGQAKRGLGLFEAEGVVAVGSDVVDGERAIGTVVSSFTHNGSSTLLAVLPLDTDVAARLQAGGRALAPGPLREGLAR